MLLWQKKSRSLDPELQDSGGSSNLLLYMPKATTQLQLIPLISTADFFKHLPPATQGLQEPWGITLQEATAPVPYHHKKYKCSASSFSQKMSGYSCLISLPLVSTWRLWSSLCSSLSPVSSLPPDTNLCWFPGSSRLLQPCNILWEDLCVSATRFLSYSLHSSMFTYNHLAFLSCHCNKQHNFSSISCWYLLGMRFKNGFASQHRRKSLDKTRLDGALSNLP